MAWLAHEAIVVTYAPQRGGGMTPPSQHQAMLMAVLTGLGAPG